MPNFIVSEVPFGRSELLRISNSAGEFWELIFGPGILSGVVGSPFDFALFFFTDFKSGVPPGAIKSLLHPIA